jgi:hypothetical protein
MALQFTRNATVYITKGSEAWKLSVLDGFSFTQSINSSEITINEAGSTSRRARLLFNDSLAPVEWSMSTYARPYKSGSDVRAPEEALWAMLLGADTHSSGVFSSAAFTEVLNIDVHAAAGLQAKGPVYEITTEGTTVNWVAIGADATAVGTKFIYNGEDITGSGGVVKETNSVNLITTDTGNVSPFDIYEDDRNVFNLSKSNVSSFADGWDIFVAFEDGTNKQYYKLESSIVNSASIDFDIDGIATIAWSGFAKVLVDTAEGALPASIATPIAGGLTDTDNFIRNRISTVSLANGADIYDIVLTGGNFTIENNVNYLTPEELGVVNAPLANITGARSISGSMTCYLDNDVANSKSGELFKDLVEDTTTIRNTHNLQISIGGNAIDSPRLQLLLPSAHLEVPTINVEDLLTLEVNFHGQVSAGDVDNTNEALIAYKA